MKNVTAQTVFEYIKKILTNCPEIIRGKVHILNISDEEDTDKYSWVRYRVYHSDGFVFDVERTYDSSLEDGAGGLRYNVYDGIWDGFQSIEPNTIEKSYELLVSEFPEPVDRYFNYQNDGDGTLLINISPLT